MNEEPEEEEQVSSDDDNINWARNPTLKLGTLEELRRSFRSELEVPSVWILQILMTLANSSSEFGPREAVRPSWYSGITHSTRTPAREPLRLSLVTWPGSTPFYRVIAWEEFNQLFGEA